MVGEQEVRDRWCWERVLEWAPLVDVGGAPLVGVHGGGDKVSAPLVVAGRRDGGWACLLPQLMVLRWWVLE